MRLFVHNTKEHAMYCSITNLTDSVLSKVLRQCC